MIRAAPPAIEASLELARRLDDPVLIGIALTSASEEYPADIEPARTRTRSAPSSPPSAAKHGLPVHMVASHILAVNAAGAALDLAEARRHIATVRELSRTYELRQAAFIAEALEAMVAFMTGDMERAEQMYAAAHETQLNRGTVDAGAAWLLVRVTLRFNQGRLGELVDELRAAYAHRVAGAGPPAGACARGGR